MIGELEFAVLDFLKDGGLIMAKPGWSERDIPDQAGKRVLVTGGASGIGFEMARALAQRRAHVIIADRNLDAGRLAVNRILAMRCEAAVEFRWLDLSDQAAIRRFASTGLSDGKPLDTLINNAGIQPISVRRQVEDGSELTFAIGHLGHFALTGLLLPALRRASDPRIVTVSSMVHGRGWIDWDDIQIVQGYAAQRAYNQTKLANLLFAMELNRRLEAVKSTIQSIAVHPGVAQTAIGKNRRALGSFHWKDHLVSATLGIVMPYLGQPAALGALPALYAATAFGATGGQFYGPAGFCEMKGPPGTAKIKPAAQKPGEATRLWAMSEALTGIRYPD